SRGLEIGSIYSSVPLFLHMLGQPLDVEFTYGSINLISPVASALTRMVPFLTAGLLIAAIGLLVFHGRRLSFAVSQAEAAQGGPPLAQREPAVFSAYALLFFMLFIATNKVFSPQYLLWLAPLLALAHFDGRSGRWLRAGFLLTCLLSTVLVPFLFAFDLVEVGSKAVPLTVYPPTLRVSIFIIARILLFVVLTVGVALDLLVRARRKAAQN